MEFMKVFKTRMSKRKPLFVSDGLPHHAHALAHMYSTGLYLQELVNGDGQEARNGS
ncbi:MAG: hypothetical protein JRG73_16965 [Deltaproteobacteria bacterium]|nr:hypothetical protein [Deltaproteobacteria bacterium]